MRLSGIGTRLPPSLSVRRAGENANTEDDDANDNRDNVRRLHDVSPKLTELSSRA